MAKGASGPTSCLVFLPSTPDSLGRNQNYGHSSHGAKERVKRPSSGQLQVHTQVGPRHPAFSLEPVTQAAVLPPQQL